MSELKYKEGDKVLIKDIDWYNANKSKSHGTVACGGKYFDYDMREWCGKTMTILTAYQTCYIMQEDGAKDLWTDEMIEGLVERNGKTYPYKIGDRVVLKGNNRCATITDLKYNSWGTLSYYIKIDNDKDISEDYPTHLLLPHDNMIECKVEEETPKYKVNDIVFVKNIGWVRITNGYWDSFANEYIYEVIGLNGEGEYDCINQSNIECQMLPESESENPHTGGNKITLDEYKNNDKEWLFNKLAMLDNITALESIQDIFNHLQQSKYPKTYEECCEVLSIAPYYNLKYHTFEHDYHELATSNKLLLLQGKLNILGKLLICRDAYWKIAGDEMGLGKPWEPDWKSLDPQYIILYQYGGIDKAETHGEGNYILTFPTAEMRDAFYENFKELINSCKELL